MLFLRRRCWREQRSLSIEGLRGGGEGSCEASEQAPFGWLLARWVGWGTPALQPRPSAHRAPPRQRLALGALPKKGSSGREPVAYVTRTATIPTAANLAGHLHRPLL